MRAPIRFTGELTDGQSVAPIQFNAGIDAEGWLTLELAPIEPGRLGAPFASVGVPLQPRRAFTLTGGSEDGWAFTSDTFYVDHWSRLEERCEVGGYCAVAELSCAAPDDHPDMRAWFMRKLGTFRGMETRTALGRLLLTGYSGEGGQVPAAALAIHAEGQELPGWWDASERLLVHMSRVLSFACSVYLLPVCEQRVRSGRMTIRTTRQSPSPPTYMPPFDALSMYEIFSCALRAFDERPEVVERLDPAVRWLTAAVAYQESRLTNAMSALECVLDRSDLPSLFIDDPQAFAALKKEIRRFLKAKGAPGLMGGKVDELNRRSFRQRLLEYLAARSIDVDDMPTDWLGAIIATRNALVHTGVAPDPQQQDRRLIDRIVWAREVITRIYLDAIGFRGRYQSWVIGGEYADFPARPPSAAK